MTIPLRFLTSALGRRETIKYLSIAAAGALIAPLTGCSGSKLAFSKFAAGSWEVSFPSVPDWPTINLAIKEDGGWSLTVANDSGAEDSGIWTLAGTSLTLTGQNANGAFFDEGQTASCTGVPGEVNEDEVPVAFSWAYNHDGLEVPVDWNKDSKTLTLTGLQADNTTFPIIAVKKD